MVNFYLSGDVADLSHGEANYYLDLDNPVNPSTVSFSVGNNVTDQLNCFYSRAGDTTDMTWLTGSTEVYIRVVSVGNVRGEVAIARIGSDGTVLDTSSTTSSMTFNAGSNYLFTVNKNWGTTNPDDRFRVDLLLTNTGNGGTSLEIEVGVAGALVETPFTFQTWDLTIQKVGEGGVLTPDVGVYTYADTMQTTINAEDTVGHKFINWEINGVVNNNRRINLTMTEHVTAIAYYEVSTYHTLTISLHPESLGGETVPSIGSHSINDGVTVAIEPAQSEAYSLNYWELEGEQITGSPLYVTVDSDKQVYANFMYSGEGTEANPYIVASVADFLDLHNYTADVYTGDQLYFKQHGNIDFTNVDMTPIGGNIPMDESRISWLHHYDGNGYTIKNITINEPTNEYIGIFGSGLRTMKNLTIDGINVTGYHRVGGICGSGGTYENVHIKNANINGLISHTEDSAFAGGFCGVGGSFYRCSFSGDVTGNSRTVGGFSGGIAGQTIEECYAEGNITGDSNVGGLIGYVGYAVPSGTNYITNCYSRTRVEATAVSGTTNCNVGVAIGYTYSYFGDPIHIHKLYGAGIAISGASGDPTRGGVIGRPSTVTSFSGIYYNTTITGYTGTWTHPELGALFEGLTSTEMRNINNMPEYDLSIWDIIEEHFQNDGFPFLRWETVTPNPPTITTEQIEREGEISWTIT